MNGLLTCSISLRANINAIAFEGSKSTLSLVAIVLLAGLQTGCVVGRRTVPLNVPESGTYAQVSKGSFFIGAPTDDRFFENQPKNPSTPSIDGDVNGMSKEQQALMIGRQRNGWGQAKGDVALPSTQSVPTLAKNLVEQGLKRHGYATTNNANNSYTANVSVNQFWGWFSPGAFSVSFEARITCKLTINGPNGAKVLIVDGYGKNVGQVASDANWNLTYERAFADFQTQLDIALNNAGL